MPIRFTSWFVWLLAPALALGCNAVLDNPPGQLATTDGAAPEVDSSVVDSTLPEDSASPTPTIDAAAPTSPDAPVEVADAAPGPVFDAGPTCPFGDKMCSGACVTAVGPAFGCGTTTCTACSLPHATAGCAASGCSVAACDPGYADCDQIATNGCETDLSQAAHCGTCNALCPVSTPYCAPTASGFACSTGCGALVLCGTQCVNTQTSVDNCGGCNNACPAVANGQVSCTSGSCGFACHAGYHACGGACASDLSPATCGASCAPCPTAPNASVTCNGAQCGTVCLPPFADCDGLAANGCEANLANDPANCGQCKVSCSGRACNSGTCAPPPPPPDAGPPDAGPPDAGPPPPDAGTDTGAPPPVDSGGSG